jgi:hypothetical protein
MKLSFCIILVAAVLFCASPAIAWEVNPNNLPPCPEADNTRFVDTGLNGRTAAWHNCWGRYTRQLDKQKKDNTIEGEWKRGTVNGYAFAANTNGDTYEGELVNGKFHGRGIYVFADGKKIEGIWENGDLVQKVAIDFSFLKKNSKDFSSKSESQTPEKVEVLLEVGHSLPTTDGDFRISIRTKPNLSSLKINSEEFGGRNDGVYSIPKIVRAGQETQFIITARDENGKSSTKTITVSRTLADSKPLVAALNPAQVKRQPERDAVAIIIGIADYKNLPRADYANDDARVFYDYAIRALGVKPENIKLLVDADADDVAIYRAFKTWLPSRVRANTDVYVFYSGHGLPTADGQGLYLLPQRADRDFIDKTAITQAEINTAIQAAKPRSVTIFLDACYSGQARTGETLLASARPVALKVERQLFPDSFTVISASQADQISSSSPDLKHGIFSYYLMRGMEGDADANRDGKITAGEMHTYLMEQVARQAGMMNRQQVPQLTGNANRVLVGR